MNLQNETILLLDFGSQYLQLVARRIRESGVYSQVVPPTISADEVRRIAPKGIVLSGSPARVFEDDTPKCDPAIYQLGIPVLGICYGMQTTLKSFGGEIQPDARCNNKSNNGGFNKENGQTALTLTELGQRSPLFQNTPPEQQVWMVNRDVVTKMSADFELLAAAPDNPVAAVKHKDKPIFAVQYHPEVAHSEFGQTLFKNFVKNICACSCDWTMKRFAQSAVQQAKEQIGDGTVICGLSGGVDSAVVAAILSKAVGKQLKCIMVDHGLLRQGETEEVQNAFGNHFDAEFRLVDAADGFFERLRSVDEPQEKRKRIGHYFIDVFSQTAKEYGGAKFLAQGTIYPDIIESGASLYRHGKRTGSIKLHHNVGGLPEKLGFELVEPLKELFKDEVRQLGIELGLPEDFVWRHPFPGPGLAVRCLGEVTPEKIAKLRAADAVVREEIHRAGLYRAVSQVFAVLLPVRSVGIKNDCRTYDEAVAVRCVTTDDFMTADWTPLPDAVLRRISMRISGEVPGVNRVVYDISSKPPATIEWE